MLYSIYAEPNSLSQSLANRFVHEGGGRAKLLSMTKRTMRRIRRYGERDEERNEERENEE
jgi:hypothetical protein